MYAVCSPCGVCMCALGMPVSVICYPFTCERGSVTVSMCLFCCVLEFEFV